MLVCRPAGELAAARQVRRTAIGVPGSAQKQKGTEADRAGPAWQTNIPGANATLVFGHGRLAVTQYSNSQCAATCQRVVSKAGGTTRSSHASF